MATSYSVSFKEKMVIRMSPPEAISATALHRETGVPQATLSIWLRKATLGAMTPKDSVASIALPPDTSRARSAEDKLRVVIEAAALQGEALGAMLRREGLHQAQIDQWRQEMLNALAGQAQQATQPSADRKKLVELEREIARKDRALAETATLLVLQKKVRSWLAGEDDDMPPRSGR